MTPQEVVIDTFGGIRAAARILDVAPSTVLRWGQPKRRGGDALGGQVPAIYHEALLNAAAARGKFLLIEHLRRGKPGIQRRVIRRF